MSEIKTKKEKALKPKYNMAQNAWYMIKLAWTSKEKKVLVLSLLSATLAVALNLINLYVSPTILSVVERQASVSELILTIILFVSLLMIVSAASSYVNTQIYYLDRCSGELSVAKDIRIFGLRSWIDELYAKSIAAYTAFHQKAQSVYIWASIVDLVLTFLRNALVYAYLIGLVIAGGLTSVIASPLASSVMRSQYSMREL